MNLTYSQLLDAIRTAEELHDKLEFLKNDGRRWKGSPEEQDNLDALIRSAENEFNSPIMVELP